jgi:hypothetical protein
MFCLQDLVLLLDVFVCTSPYLQEPALQEPVLLLDVFPECVFLQEPLLLLIVFCLQEYVPKIQIFLRVFI